MGTLFARRPFRFLFLAMAVTSLGIGCDAFTPLELTNSTGEPIMIRYAEGYPGTFNSPGFEPDGFLIGPILPGEIDRSRQFANVESSHSHMSRRLVSIVALKDDDTIIFRRIYNWDELKELDFKVEITPQ